nr:MAG TPA: hypothetical protein [Bacteriophage sp.]
MILQGFLGVAGYILRVYYKYIIYKYSYNITVLY